MALRYSTILIILVAFLQPIYAQKGLQTPDEFLPHQLGEQFTPHHLLTDYFEYVAANAPATVKLERYGNTNEARPLQVAMFSSPENMARLEQIRLNNMSIAGMSNDNGKGNPLNAPAIVWLNMSVHGNEPSGAECSMLLAWQLATQTDASIKEWLKNTVVIIDPSCNPDGYDHYTSWYRMSANLLKNPHGKSREHDEPWPGGRPNHYYYDLNRDWAWATQVETRQRLDLYQRWLPHVLADLHEQYIDDPYYFAPAAEPMHAFITPWQRDFQVKMGTNHAHYFDQKGWLYFTNEVFDLLYPSYGDTYPMFNGAIGMTYEQAGHSTAGRATIMANKDTLTLHDRIAHHLTTSISTIEMASKNAQQLVDNFKEFYAKGLTDPPGQYGAFIIKASNDPNSVNMLCQLLDRHKIRYGRAGASTSAKGFDYGTGKEATYTVQPEDLVISAYQSKAVLTQVLFEPSPYISDSLTYDITAWALPFAYGLEAFASKQRIDPKKEFAPFIAPEVNITTSPYAWCVHRRSLSDYTWAASLTDQGIKLRYATEPFTISDQQFEAGTLIVNRADNRHLEARLDAMVKAAATKANVSLHPIFTGFINNKGSDMGSSKYKLLNSPAVAVLYGSEVDENSFGHTWYFFEQELQYPVDMIRFDKVNSVSLDGINTLVIPNGGYRFSEETLEGMKEWVADGGRIIAFDGGAKALADKDGFELRNKTEGKPQDTPPPYQQAERYHISDQLPGAIIKTVLDPTHPLSYGLNGTYFSLKTNSNAFQQNNKLSTAIRIGDQVEAFGFIGSRVKTQLNNSPIATVQQIGNGSVVYLIDNPLFRSFWQTGKMLFANALFF
jgi:Zinc carboxypeptidase